METSSEIAFPPLRETVKTPNDEMQDVADKERDVAAAVVAKQACIDSIVKDEEGKESASVWTTASVLAERNHSSARTSEVVKALNEGVRDVADREGDLVFVKQACIDPIVNEEDRESAPVWTTASVLAERNLEDAANCEAASKVVSPLPSKLRRNQERTVSRATTVDPVQPLPQSLRGFSVDRYTSPTDSIMSPISRGLLARNSHSAKVPLPVDSSKGLDCKLQNAEVNDFMAG